MPCTYVPKRKVARSDLRAVPVLKLHGVWMEDSVGAMQAPLTSGARTAYPNRQSCVAHQSQPRRELAVHITRHISERSRLRQLTSTFPLFPLLGLPELPRVSRCPIHLTCQHHFSVRNFANEATMLQPRGSSMGRGHRNPSLKLGVKICKFSRCRALCLSCQVICVAGM